MKIGFIGAGNMATAIIKGIINASLIDASDIFAYDLCSEKTDILSESLKITACDSPESVISKSDAVVIAVKPNVFQSLFAEINNSLKQNNVLIISIAAGKSLDFISNLLDFDARIIRIMPNINATVGEAMSAYCYNSFATENDIEFVDKLCSSFGKAIDLPESQFSIFSVIAGCAPAFAYMFIDSLARAAVKNGMPKNTALEIAAQTVLGSAKQITESNLHPWDLVDKVCSPGGTTIEGVSALQDNNFEAAIQKAVDASYEKDRRI